MLAPEPPPEQATPGDQRRAVRLDQVRPGVERPHLGRPPDQRQAVQIMVGDDAFGPRRDPAGGEGEYVGRRDEIDLAAEERDATGRGRDHRPWLARVG
jgi:hypothetical protein